MCDRVERQGKQRRLCPHALGLGGDAKMYQQEPMHFQIVCRSTLAHPHPRQKKLAHAQRSNFRATPHSVLSWLVAPTREALLSQRDREDVVLTVVPSSRFLLCPSTWPSELQKEETGRGGQEREAGARGRTGHAPSAQPSSNQATATRTAPSTSVTHLPLNERAHAAELPTRPTQR
eukprot:COSAG02_NODE_7420_length_3023_cov_12.110465_1_plen_176_part_00